MFQDPGVGVVKNESDQGDVISAKPGRFFPDVAIPK